MTESESAETWFFMNIRMPEKVSAELLELRDEYLQEKKKAKGVVTLADIPTIRRLLENR